MPTHSRPYVIEVLLVEDNPDDAFLAQEAIHDGAANCHLTHIEDGAEAMAFLHGEGKYANAPTPHVVLLDINLPKKNGLQVLREMKADRALCGIPVVMMTTSSDPKDLLEALNGQAHRYITKPVAVPVFLATLRAIVADGGPCELDAARAADLQSWIRELDRC